MTQTTIKLISEIESKSLPIEEEKRLFKIYQNQEEGWFEAKNTIVHSCLLFVIKCANDCCSNPEKIEDLISEGVMGLMEAMDKFDNGKDVRFLTFASYSIRGKIFKYLSKTKYNAFYVSQDTGRLVGKIKNYIDNFQSKNEYAPSREQIMKQFDLDDLAVAYFLELINVKDFSLDCCTFEDSLVSRQFEDKAAIIPDNALNKKESQIILEKIVDNLPLKQKIVISKRFGFNDGERKDLASIGEELALTKQRVAQIEIQALKTIKREIKKQNLTIECLQ
jgi:RNA polymerase nonessential primary-like sigma factor